MSLFITVLHVIVCIILVVVVLLQQGKGAEMGAVFGGGGGNTVFGSRGASTFLSKLTTWSIIIFFFTSIGLSYLAISKTSSVFDEKSASTPALQNAEEESEESTPFTEVDIPPSKTEGE